MQSANALRTHRKSIEYQDLCQADLQITRLTRVPKNAVARNDGIILDTECGGFYYFRGAQVFEIPQTNILIVNVADRGMIIPPDYLSPFALDRGVWAVTSTAAGAH